MNHQTLMVAWVDGLARTNWITLPLWPGAERLCGDFECS